MNFSDLKDIVKGDIEQWTTERTVTDLLVDSRKLVVVEGAVFFALSGERKDGHAFIEDVYKAGVRQFVIEKHLEVHYPHANILRVNSSLDALQAVVEAHRKNFQLPVIGITGSNGKTIIKEWLFQLLLKDYAVVKNPGSYNSQVGVPLSVWQIQHHHALGIFEAGISKPGEMEKLERMIRPSLGIFTNIGPAHDEGFLSLEQKILEKLKLFKKVNTLIFCHDHVPIREAIRSKNIPSLSWGFTEGSDMVITQRSKRYSLRYAGREHEFTLPFYDRASVENCLHCIAVMLHLNIGAGDIQQRINLLHAIAMRLELKEGINRCQIIDDSYNNDIAGLQISIDFLNHQKQKRKKHLILSDIMQSGLSENELIKNIIGILKNNAIDKFTGIGSVLYRHRHEFNDGSFFQDTNSFLQAFQPGSYEDEIILVKGARPFEFEKIVHRLQRKVHGTVMEVNLNALVQNLNFFKTLLKPGTKVMVMVKAFAYGSGSVEVANVLQYHRVDYLGVAYADEGVDLRHNNIHIPIMVMNPSEESFEQFIQYQLEPEIYSFKLLESYISFLGGRSSVIHIKLDTGMHRLGFEEEEIDRLIALLNENRNLLIGSIFSHLAGADDPHHDEFSFTQGKKFLTGAEKISKAIGYKPLYHIVNSPGILRLPQLHLDMVRLGIGLYGVDPTGLFPKLMPVASLKTMVSQVKTIKKGESIGYGRKGNAATERRIATIAIGYADGFSRAFSNGVGHVLIKGKRAPVIGNVCMDMTMVDVTNLDVHEGDEVIIFGGELPIQEVAEQINTIPYELLATTSERVKRVFVAESI